MPAVAATEGSFCLLLVMEHILEHHMCVPWTPRHVATHATLHSVLPLDEIALAIAGLNGPRYTSNPTLAYYLSLLRLVALVRLAVAAAAVAAAAAASCTT